MTTKGKAAPLDAATAARMLAQPRRGVWARFWFGFGVGFALGAVSVAAMVVAISR